MASDSDRANQSMMTPEDLSNIKGMITAYRMLAGVASTSKERMKIFLWGLIRVGSTKTAQFVDSGQLYDIESAIACQRLGLEYASDGSSEKLTLLNNLGKSYQRRFKYSSELADLEFVVEYLGQAISGTPDGHPVRPEMLSNLGAAHLYRFERLGERLDCDKGLDYLDQALVLTPDSNEWKPDMLRNIARLHTARFGRLGEQADLLKTIHYLSQAKLLSSDGHKRMPGLLEGLANSCLTLFQRFNDTSALGKAIDYYNQDVLLKPIGNSNRQRTLLKLASLYYARFDRLGELVDIDDAINCYKRVVSLLPDGHQDKLAGLHGLGSSYQMRFQHAGSLADLDNAIAYQSQAVSLAPDSNELKNSFLDGLGNSYQCRFERLGVVEDVDKAVDYHRQAVSLTPCSHQYRPLMLTNSGSAHYNRFMRLGDISDMNKAINYMVEAVSLIADDDASKPDILNTLGLAYHARYRALEELPDINDAIVCLSQAVSLAPDSSVEKPRALGNLGISYTYRFHAQGERSDINQAIEYLNKAVLLTSPHHSFRPGRLQALGDAYQARFTKFREPVDNIQSLSCQQKAVSLIPDGHACKPRALLGLGISCMVPGEHINSLMDEEIRTSVAISSFRQAAQCQTGDPYTRFCASRTWAKITFLEDDERELAYRRTMELLPDIVWLGATIDQRYKMIMELGDVATEAASFAISCGNYDQALEWLEEARSIVWSQILQLRTPVQELAAAVPELANRLETVGRQLEHAGLRSSVTSVATNSPPNLEKDAEHHRNLASEWNRLINQARAIPSFHNFMHSRKGEEFLCVAKDGPVVVINVHSSRCDALILQPNSDNIAHLPLTRFSLAEAINIRTNLMISLETPGERARGFKRSNPPLPEKFFKETLATLWSDVVKPIFDFLGYRNKLPVDELPHITWCATGPLSFLPLHAAGCYDGAQPNAFDLAVSSYTPTLSALLTPTSQTPSPHAGILAVGQEHTKGLDELPNTVHELMVIKEHANSARCLQLDGNDATVESVLSAMGECSWVHLACHATQNREYPGQSAFHLSDGNLALATISKQSFSNKGLAFLSACQTAAGDDKLPDEAVHLAAGMLLAGYPSVIATMWSIYDEDAPDVTKHVYAELFGDGTMNHRRACRALHGAVAALREKVGEESFRRWVPFIHIGL